MTVAANIEWKVEAAFVAVLGANADLASVAVVRFHDRSVTPSYPCVVINCQGAGDEDWAVLRDFSRMLVDVTAMTYTAEDTTAASVNNTLGACRDTIYDPSIVEDLTNAVAGLTVWGAHVEAPMYAADDTDYRRRTITVTVHASARDLGVITDSSSSSTSSGT